jgi:hypothetical protein
MRAVLSPSSFAKLGDHVGELNTVLRNILLSCMEEGFIPQADLEELAQLVLGSLAASADRGRREAETDQHTEATVRFIQLGVGARFDEDGRPTKARETSQLR